MHSKALAITPAYNNAYFFMRVDSVAPSVEMLRVCFQKGFNFTVRYRGGVSVKIDSDHDDDENRFWRFERSKDRRPVSWFFFTLKNGAEVEASDVLTKALVESVYQQQATHKKGLFGRDFYELLENILRIYGGKVAHINSVALDEERL